MGSTVHPLVTNIILACKASENIEEGGSIYFKTQPPEEDEEVWASACNPVLNNMLMHKFITETWDLDPVPFRVKTIVPLFQKSASTTVLCLTIKELYFQLFSYKLLQFTVQSKIAGTTSRKNDHNVLIHCGVYQGLFFESCAFSHFYVFWMNIRQVLLGTEKYG